MKNNHLSLLLFSLLSLTLSAQNLPKNAKIIGASLSKILLPQFIEYDENTFPAFSPQVNPTNVDIFPAISTHHKLVREEKDDLGFTHYRYKQTLNGLPIEGADFLYHTQNGKLITANGFWLTGAALAQIEAQTIDKISEKTALKAALNHINAKQYRWEIAEIEQMLKSETGDPNASFRPKGEKVFVKFTEDWTTKGVRLAWKFDIYAQEPVSRRLIYVDAENGKILTENEEIHTVDVAGTANTAYSGVKPIVSDNYAVGAYRLRETGRGNGINTLNLRNSTNIATAVNFTNASANWNLTGKDQHALDAHFGAEVTYDYFKNIHNRNSIDNAGFALNSYVHYSTNYTNAFWDGSRMFYGDGSGTVTPLTALDVAGHEISHGLTTYTANLTYSNESGALNESFSDIFGTAIEFYAQPTTFTPNWTIGERMNFTIRNMANPNQYSQPDTYKGTYWTSSSSDNGGVHTNSGVQNYWFYLLVNGGSGTNDKGTVFNVQGLGMDKAAKIAFRSLTVYLTSSAQYINARMCSIRAAIDLFGANSNEVAQVKNAWCAVGVGTCTATPPSVSIASPANNALITTSTTTTNITISTAASDPDGYLTKVEYFNGATKLGEDLSNVFAYIETYIIYLYIVVSCCYSSCFWLCIYFIKHIYSS